MICQHTITITITINKHCTQQHLQQKNSRLQGQLLMMQIEFAR
jgi:hypothetical protein